MRKIATVSMIAAAAFAVSACSKTESTNVVEVNSMDSNMMVEGTTNDMVTNVDGAMGASNNMVEANAMGETNAMGATNATNAM